MTKEKFGFYVENIKVKVVFDGRAAGKGWIVRVSYGEKQKDDTWANEFMNLWGRGETPPSKGMRLKVTGRAKLSKDTYKGETKNVWMIFADSIALDEPSSPAARPALEAMDDVPF